MDEDDVDVPEEAESVLEDLFKALRDKDTVVRYSAAKGVARIAERLPADFAEQVLEQVLHLFAIHSAGIATIYDLPSIAEATWHGACLACAEMARRGLIPDERLSELVGWLYKVCPSGCAVLSMLIANRRCCSTYVKAHTRLDRTCVTPPPMSYGPLRAHRELVPCSLMP